MDVLLARHAMEGTRVEAEITSENTAAKRLGMCWVEHFRSHFQSHFPVKVFLVRLHSVCSLRFVVPHAARVFDHIVVFEIAFMDDQAQIT